MASRLAPCPSCSRHVKVGPPSCPFCGADVPTQVAARVLNLAAGKPLTRAALLFAGAAAVTACSSSSSGGGTSATHDAAIDRGEPEPAYGVISHPADAGEPDDAGEEIDAVLLYGVFADAGEFPDAGDDEDAAEDDAGEPDDAGPEIDGQQGAPAYGAMADPDGGQK